MKSTRQIYDTLNKIDYQDMVIEERDKEILKIAQEMQDVNQLFKQLQELVVDQGEDIGIIGNNILDTKKNVEDGKESLEEAERQQKRCAIF